MYGKHTENTKVVRTSMIEIPSGIQEVTSVPEIWRKNGKEFEFLTCQSTKNMIVDFMKSKCLGATHIHFTAWVGSSTICPDDSAETKSYYYFIDCIKITGTMLKWYYSNDRLIHEDMPTVPEKAMKKPYPKAL
ncbi:MAG: hypothetical protein K2I80_00545 [Ruminococcus sp.]|nr:hypothetical protein [Ruminococcus sp.]MDE6849551.1 hypothetical protein [Ruminococcus sp.]